MVFFTCDACGESLKKAQVEKHLLKCRGCRVLSCIDCGNDFRGDDYKNHNKCISEDQKYGGKDFQAKANKGDVKQQQWIQRIQEASDRPGVQPRLQQVLRQVAAYGNVPRKRAKFQNWMKNSLKIHSPELLEQVWEIFSAADSDCNQTTEEHKPNRSEPTNGTETNEGKREERKDKKRESERETSEQQNGKKQSRKKRKREERGQDTEEKTKKRREEPSDESQDLEGEEPENQQSESNSTGKFNWKGTIKAVLRDAPEDGLAVKKLRKKVLAAYYSFTGDGNYRSEEELLSLFNKKINNNPKFKTLKEKVRLVK
ncbi:cell growth-regulating nucleolar protein [Pimephales promelas]|uniref:cell growth-regulating nucleolar protein n=1 Tax=Pimephales promelas TaxID=90988 RepID=UPI001955853E|nr:cell growth-regulating nucleolar protein [Pimephales promelas]XP_039510847.1 cell growth-regulating nucleolar protein [Pimephales promelas]XP_039510849.1 cell growth-regulating nucleolar protein [Pimephales promelas]XP_039510850.1 cell growth-regulating nucleolar protein [Pimephales promelas]XP_039510851.1 cell growth-regulating nucleolar protein [Pimephales promelas]